MNTTAEQLISNHTKNVDVIKDSNFEVVFSVLIFGVISICGAVLNTLLITAILSAKKLRTSAGAIIVVLSMSDLFLCLFIYPLQAYGSYTEEWDLSYIGCVLNAVTLQICTFERIFAFPMVAYNRYVLITKSKSEYIAMFKPSKTAGMLICSWLLTVILICTPLIDTADFHIEFNTAYDICVVHNQVSFVTIVEFIVFAICLIITLTSYTKLVRYLYTHVQDTRTNLQAISQIQSKKLGLQVVKMMALVSCSFCICVFPYLCLRLIDPNLTTLSPINHKISLLILSAGSLVNPLVFTFTNVWHRKAIKAVLTLRMPDTVVVKTT